MITDAEMHYQMVPYGMSSFHFIRLECIRDESWINSMGPNNGHRAFGYNSAKAEPIWMKLGKL